MLPVVPRRDVERIRDRIVPRLTGGSLAGCAFSGAGVECTLAIFMAGAPKRARTRIRG
ncbi:protein of unknown function [Methylorubrum extorquens DM4]|uniref:Uncharacterized protein n=1 Tax=Methylorubrum extorquens (strain DSM 6343 / CIP 106787 / DM4) TaxID=661410 RepID=C7CHB4_METED|nr:protein of unknown function [Methylorubrum extorquens DM4]